MQWRAQRAVGEERFPHPRREFMHARSRMFADALKGQKNKPSPRITKALEFFQALYQVKALAKHRP